MEASDRASGQQRLKHLLSGVLGESPLLDANTQLSQGVLQDTPPPKSLLVIIEI